MPRSSALVPMLAVFLAVVGSTHYYVWARLVRDVGLPAPWPTLLAGAFAALALSLPAAMVVSHTALAPHFRWLLWAAYLWMGLFFLALCCTAVVDGAHLAVSLSAPLTGLGIPSDPERRLLWSRCAGAGIAAVATAAAAAAARTALAGPQLFRVPVTLARLPHGLDGLTIAQISDLHVAHLIRRPYVEQVVAKTNALAPGIIVLTGDLIDGSVEQLRDAVAPLAALRAQHGVFFVTGNHEYYSGVDAWLDELRRLGIRVLRNERVSIGSGAQSFDLAGVDDLTAAAYGHGHGCDIPGALAGRDPTRELVLLAHQPRAVHQAAEHGVGLMLSGHTHGGQIWPFGALVRLAQPYLAGLARHGNTQIYVNRGTGFWGPPMRLAAAPELTLLTLRAGIA